MLCIANTKYEATRKDKPHVLDIELAEPNVDLMKEYLQTRLAISEKDIKYLKNPTKGQLAREHKAMKELAKELDRKGGERKLLLFVIYSGHGVQTTSSHFLLNSEEPDKRFFDIEQKMLAIASAYRHTFGIGLFDCCREEASKEDMKKRDQIRQTNEATQKAIEKVTSVVESLETLKA